jgi:hypothetical protein
MIGLYEKLCIIIGMVKNNKTNKKNNKLKIKNEKKLNFYFYFYFFKKRIKKLNIVFTPNV